MWPVQRSDGTVSSGWATWCRASWGVYQAQREAEGQRPRLSGYVLPSFTQEVIGLLRNVERLMDPLRRQQNLEDALIFLVLLEEVGDDLPPGSLSLLLGPPKRGQERGVQQGEHAVVVDQQEHGRQQLPVSLETHRPQQSL